MIGTPAATTRRFRPPSGSRQEPDANLTAKRRTRVAVSRKAIIEEIAGIFGSLSNRVPAAARTKRSSCVMNPANASQVFDVIP